MMKTNSEIRHHNILLKWLFLVVLSTGFLHFNEVGVSRTNRVELVSQRRTLASCARIPQITHFATSTVSNVSSFYDFKNYQSAIFEILKVRLSIASRLVTNSPKPLMVRQSVNHLHFKSRSLSSEDPIDFYS
ncbi:hypothetical protein LZD49_28990 [Dyadobacter sp. CY261]|uniref:hypothetical protein n=1 Tax=Dyadobacter sp. CY261 TaxID=2907203 RepID=UPI001F25263A|nr:hypothetical protein [Dyadobacter sp. CY261]MCF0074556.1 hypothetical protein [Dyadobacter sp. CY261]